MNGDRFIDTNVLLYAHDLSEPVKQPIAEGILSELWARRQGRLSMQVLQEFYYNATRKLKPGLGDDDAREVVRTLQAWKPIRTDEGMLESAWIYMDRFGFSWWDAQIVAAAKRADCSTLLTEDLQHGLDVDGMKIINPFLAA
jgi:predicted nucleic acid-binding protein